MLINKVTERWWALYVTLVTSHTALDLHLL